MNAPRRPDVVCPRLGLQPPSWAVSPPGRDFEIYASALAHFTSIPWTSALLNPTSDKTVEIVTFTTRGVIPVKDQQNVFIISTLFKPGGLSHMLCFVRTSSISRLLDPSRLVRRLYILYTVGDELTGYTGLIHGGMLMTLMDETMGALHILNAALDKKDPVYAIKQNMTAELRIKFLKPAKVGTVLVECWIESVKGRKIVMGCEIRDKDGVVLAKGTSIWITPKAKL